MFWSFPSPSDIRSFPSPSDLHEVYVGSAGPAASQWYADPPLFGGLAEQLSLVYFCHFVHHPSTGAQGHWNSCAVHSVNYIKNKNSTLWSANKWGDKRQRCVESGLFSTSIWIITEQQVRSQQRHNVNRNPYTHTCPLKVQSPGECLSVLLVGNHNIILNT